MYPNNVGPAFASSGQTIATFKCNRSQHWWVQHVHAFAYPVATCCELKIELVRMPGCNIVTHVAKRLQHTTSTNLAWKIWPFSNLNQQHPTRCNTLQQGGQMHATCFTQQCCDMLRWKVGIIWQGLYVLASEFRASPLEYKYRMIFVLVSGIICTLRSAVGK